MGRESKKKKGGLEGLQEKKQKKKNKGGLQKKNRGGIVLRIEAHDQNRRGKEGKKERKK
jgi:hypothetical protein